MENIKLKAFLIQVNKYLKHHILISNIIDTKKDFF